MATVSAATTTDFEHRVLDQINAARVSRGLVVLRTDGRLWDLAGDRAAAMASHNVLSHTVAGALNTSLTRRGISWYTDGETIGWTTPRGFAAADALVKLWRNSPAHWAILMSDRYNYLGVGLARRSSNGRTFGSVVMTESRDHSGPRATVTGGNPDRQRHPLDLDGRRCVAPDPHRGPARLHDPDPARHGRLGPRPVRTRPRRRGSRRTWPTAAGTPCGCGARIDVGNIGAWSTRRIWVP